MSDDDDGPYEIEALIGSLSMTVSGPDEEWVRETFDEEWAERLEEASEMKEAIRQANPSYE